MGILDKVYVINGTLRETCLLISKIGFICSRCGARIADYNSLSIHNCPNCKSQLEIHQIQVVPSFKWNSKSINDYDQLYIDAEDNPIDPIFHPAYSSRIEKKTLRLTKVEGSTKLYPCTKHWNYHGYSCGFCKNYLTLDTQKCLVCNNEIIEIINPGTFTPSSTYILEEMANTMSENTRVYNIRVQSPFILTSKQVKEKLGVGYKVVSVDVEKETRPPDIKDTDSAVNALIQIGYRALARAYHPDLGGDVNTMVILNKAKKEITELLESLK